VQCGFCSPGFIVSAYVLLAKNVNPTRQEVRDWFTKNNNLCRCTGYQPLVDSVMAAAKVMRGEASKESLVYEIPPDGRIYNTRYPRPSALAKVMGVYNYGDDIGIKMPPDTLHMAVTWSRYGHANILCVDTSEAEKMQGVYKVVTARDVQGTNQLGAPITHLRSKGGVNIVPILCDTKVRRVGDAIAIVIADNATNARAAAKQVKVEYEPLPVYNSYLEACIPEAVSISGQYPNVFLYQPLFKGADTREIFDKAEDPDSGIYAAKGSFSSTRQPHLPLEPWSLQSYYDEDDNLTINFKAQALNYGMQLLPRAIGIEPEKLRIIESPTGASFGAAMEWISSALIGVAEIAVKRPITWTMTYEESQRFTGKRAASFSNGRIACDKNGKILALEADVALDHGSCAQTAGSLEAKSIRFLGYPYKIPNIRSLCRAGLSNQPPAVTYRAFGSPQAYTFSEQIIDMAAAKIGMDPFEFRYINVVEPGDTAPYGAPYKSYPVRSLMDKIKPYYTESLKWAKEQTPPDIKRGVGVACGGYHVSVPVDKSEVALELNPDGSVTHWNSWEDQGQGGDIGTLVLTHEALRPLGLLPQEIKLYQNDTKYCPLTGPAAGSRSHYMAGHATLDAANKLLTAMRKPDGSYRTYSEMAEEGIPTKYNGLFSTVGMHTGISADTGQGNPTPDNNFIFTVARVEVNTSTGKTTVCGAHASADVGVIGNYQAIEGQALGGLFHAIGFAVSENYSDDVKKYANPLGCGFPRCNDTPDDIAFEFIENPRPHGPFGSGGASECFQSSGHVAVLNAIFNATGVRVRDMPATPDKIKEGLQALARGEMYDPEPYYLGEDFDEIMDDIIANPVEKPK
jgi:aldehyde oxidoreductase